jgi:hypothetical protein
MPPLAAARLPPRKRNQTQRMILRPGRSASHSWSRALRADQPPTRRLPAEAGGLRAPAAFLMRRPLDHAPWPTQGPRRSGAMC